MLTLPEEVRKYIRDRWNQKKHMVQTWPIVIGSRILLLFSMSIGKSRCCSATHPGANLFEVAFGINKQAVINLNNQTCICRIWILTGIPCEHAIRSILFQNENTMNYVHPLLKKKAYHLAYRVILNPIPSKEY